MSEVPFHATVQGRRFFEGALPKLVEQLGTLNANLAALVEALEGAMHQDETD